jgi:dephospho-CoA kinase
VTEKGHNRPYVLGVTGNIACGKSAVLAMLRELGAETIDADRLYHELISPGFPLWRSLRDRYGDGIVADSGEIDRRALGTIVFSDPVALADLDRITHPAVIDAALHRINLSRARVVAIDAVKLVQSGMADLCDQVWLVECAPPVQLERLVQRTGLSEEEARRRIAAQPPLEPARAAADIVIDNSGPLDRTRQHVQRAWSWISILQS